MANSYMTRTNGTSGDRQVWTMSAWVKFSKISVSSCIFSTGTATSDTGALRILNVGGDQIQIRSGATVFRTTTAVFRDTAAWYHIVVAQDSTQATADDRMKLYINGSQITDFSTNNAVPLNLNGPVNESGKVHTIGRRSDNNGDYLDGYIAHFHLIDGTQYAASDFGQTDATTGIWKPKLSPSVTYGTNGVFLKFASSGSLGTDSSGNSNTYSVNGNLKQSQTTPSNVFCKPNQLDYAGDVAEMEKNGLRLNNSGGGNDVAARGTFAVKSGKWYYEAKSTISAGHGNRKMVGFVDTESPVNYPRTLTANAWKGVVVDLYNGDVFRNASGASNSGSWGNGDIIQVFMDLDNGLMYLGKNGSMLNSGNAMNAALDSGIFYSPYFCQDGGGSNNGVMDYNMGEGTFGGGDVSSANSDANGYGLFEYEPTHNGVNYYALCTKNINTYG